MKTGEIRRTAVVLAAGTGSRMKAKVAKQFLELAGKPLIYYALHAVEESKIIDDCILVTGADDLERMKKEIVERFSFHKIKAVIEGGSERCFSVANAMRWIEDNMPFEGKHYIFIQDGARPFLTEEILARTNRAVMECDACVAAVPSKDTVKLAGEDGFAACTLERKKVWCVQTPQVFERNLIVEAYAKFEKDIAISQKALVTDDASVVEGYTQKKVKLVECSYENIKVTTPEDLMIAEAFLKKAVDGSGES